MQQAICASCGRVVLLQPGETRSCPSCGSSLSAPLASSVDEQTLRLPGPPLAAQDDGTTRPIDLAALPPAPAHPIASGDTMSSQPQPTNRDAPAVATNSTPLWPGDPTTQALPLGYVPPPAPEASEPRAAMAQKRSRAPLVFSVLALVLLLVLVSVGGVLASAHIFPFASTQAMPTATAAPTLPPTATVPTGYLLYRDLQAVYTIDYPAEWTAKPQAAQGGTGVALVKPDSTAAIVILQVSVSGTPTNQALVENQFQQLSKQGAVTNQQQLADRTIGATSWSQGSADWLPSQQGAVAEHVVVLATVHDGRAFVIELLESSSNANSADEATLETMLASFTFL